MDGGNTSTRAAPLLEGKAGATGRVRGCGRSCTVHCHGCSSRAADNAGCSYALTGKTAAELREQKKAKAQGDSIALTGISLFTQQMLGQPRSAAVVAACAERILRDLPKADSPNLYQWYYCTLALAMLGSDNPHWIHYRWSVKTVPEESQVPLAPPMDAGGSFSDQHDKFWTAISVL